MEEVLCPFPQPDNKGVLEHALEIIALQVHDHGIPLQCLLQYLQCAVRLRWRRNASYSPRHVPRISSA